VEHRWQGTWAAGYKVATIRFVLFLSFSISIRTNYINRFTPVHTNAMRSATFSALI
jgi:hypothetical protein